MTEDILSATPDKPGMVDIEKIVNNVLIWSENMEVAILMVFDKVEINLVFFSLLLTEDAILLQRMPLILEHARFISLSFLRLDLSGFECVEGAGGSIGWV